ncbi:MAG: MFS transporter [Prolixibacteraceae bacterium]|nr:MFS transporter [Burkholderiales bacterium]
MSSPFPHPLLYRLVHVHREEIAAMLWSFAYFFWLLCSYYVLRPVRDEMGIQAGVANLPWLFTATFIAMIAAVPLFGWVSSRFTRRKLLPAVYLFFAANLLLLHALMESGIAPARIAQAFFIWVSVFNLFVVSVFWSFMADVFRNEQARRLYGFIAAGGSTGALVGPIITAMLAPVIGPANLLPLSAAMLLAAVLCIYRLAAWSDRNPADHLAPGKTGAAIGGSIFGGVSLALKSPYLLGICVYVALGTLLGTFLYFHQANIIAVEVASSAERTALFAKIDFAVNVLTLICQFFIVGRLIGRFGVGFALTLLPIAAVAGFIAIGLMPTLTVLVVFQVIRRAGEYAIARPAREILFTVLNREEKYKSKNFIDTVVFRGGDAASGWLFEGLRMIGLGFAGIAFVGVPIGLLWAGTGWWLGRNQEDLRNRGDARRGTDESQSTQTHAAPGPAGADRDRHIGSDDTPVVR